MRIDIKGTIIPNDDKWFYDWLGWDATCPKDVVDAIAAANGEALDIYINSSGGDVFSGSQIYSELRAYKGKITIHIFGIAASAASVIACAGESEISPTAVFMVHNVSCLASGDCNALDKQANVLRQLNKSVAAAYCSKSGMTEERALELMNNETWLTAADVVSTGLVDRIAGAEATQFVASATQLISQASISKVASLINQNKLADAQIQILKLKGELQ